MGTGGSQRNAECNCSQTECRQGPGQPCPPVVRRSRRVKGCCCGEPVLVLVLPNLESSCPRGAVPGACPYREAWVPQPTRQEAFPVPSQLGGTSAPRFPPAETQCSSPCLHRVLRGLFVSREVLRCLEKEPRKRLLRRHSPSSLGCCCLEPQGRASSVLLLAVGTFGAVRSVPAPGHIPDRCDRLLRRWGGRKGTAASARGGLRPT